MILVTGATGLNGSELVRRLAAKGIPSRALVRNLAKAQPLAALPGVEVVEGDMARPESLVEALRAKGHRVTLSSWFDGSFGHAHAIARDARGAWARS